ncbi:hypothetical protein B0H66DRAFT_567588 [Apodospora peruviana]|uniref:Chitin-binding type-1 domain-containing protein n=1 Tax=Apodospora peruviana TaxID=516989 RepID=A0AAE0HW74_9PEZI|nr:hypothetical protein B0H66DRAFT_567588 [Apodospora peruviana]
MWSATRRSAAVLAAAIFTLMINPSSCCEFITTTLPPAATGACKPVTWENKNDNGAATPTTTSVAPRPTHTYAVPWKLGSDVQEGEIFCRYHAKTYEDVGPNECARLADRYGLSLDKFYFLNPTLVAPDCGGIRPWTSYCVRGFIEPVRAYDGWCGPDHRDATCIGMDRGQCCNSETWRCGDRNDEDCAPGICYEGVCWGHKVYTTDGTCGEQNGGRQCAGKWGDCCSKDGRCGTGDEFCAEAKCQSGNCVCDHV